MKRILLLISALLAINSCGNEKSVQFKETVFDGTSVFSQYILPQNSSELLKDLNYRHLYKISLKIDRTNKQVKATGKIRYYNNSGLDLSEIYFRLLMNDKANTPMSIQSVEIEDLPVEFSISNQNSTLIIEMKRKLIHGKAIELTLNYSIDFTNDPAYYFDFARIDDNGFSIPHFYPVAARNIKGEWENDPLFHGGDLLSADSSWYIVDIETDEDVVLLTTGKEISSEVRKGKQKRTYIAGPVRDFFISGSESFIPQVTISGETNIISYSQNNDSARSAEAARVTSSALSLFNGKFGTYPYKDLQIAALPMSALGIEFPGLFAINEELYRDRDSYLFEPTIVHETAHQWFYSLLGNNQLREPWIDEGLTQYATWLYYRERYGSSAALSLFNSFIERWDRVGREKIPINRPVSFYRDKEYGAIIYGRAPLFFIEVHNVMGESEFHRFIRHLIKRYSHKHMDTETFRKEIIHFAGSSIDPLFESYFD